LQRHRKIPTTLPILRRKPAAEKNRHAKKKQKKRRTSNAERPISNSKKGFSDFDVGCWTLEVRRFLLPPLVDARAFLRKLADFQRP
jgi:hypothetical protein